MEKNCIKNNQELFIFYATKMGVIINGWMFLFKAIIMEGVLVWLGRVDPILV